MARNLVRPRRKALGLTQVELARRSGVSRRALYNVELGGRCRMTTKRKLLQGLGLPFEQRKHIWPEE